VAKLRQRQLQQVQVKRTLIALSFVDGEFSAISGVCNHVGGPLGEGRLAGEHVVCPWHSCKFHRSTGQTVPVCEQDCVPRFTTKVQDGHLLVDLGSATPRSKKPDAPHALLRPIRRDPGSLRMVGVSTTTMDAKNPRYSASDHLLAIALGHAGALGAETRFIRLQDLPFRACEGYYSKSARACTWPCSITRADPSDEMHKVYEALVFWADVVLLATPIRSGAASSLFYRMAERLHCVRNQLTTHDRVLIRNKVAAFIVVGGHDSVQAVSGHLLGFFADLGFLFPQFPLVAHSRGWSSADMERNVAVVQQNLELHQAAQALVARALGLSTRLLDGDRPGPAAKPTRARRKAQP